LPFFLLIGPSDAGGGSRECAESAGEASQL
jgi:hypothetical protein